MGPVSLGVALLAFAGAPAPAPAPPGCPAALADGVRLVAASKSLQFCEVRCMGDCTLACLDPSSCSFVQLECPLGAVCEMQCAGDKACVNSQIKHYVPGGGATGAGMLTQRCTGPQACRASKMSCDGGSCMRQCDADESCEASIMTLKHAIAAPPAASLMCHGRAACSAAVINFPDNSDSAPPNYPVSLECTGDAACTGSFKVTLGASGTPYAVSDAIFDTAFGGLTCGATSACCVAHVYNRCVPPPTAVPPTPAPNTVQPLPAPTVAGKPPGGVTAVPPTQLPTASAAPPPTLLPDLSFPDVPETHYRSGFGRVVAGTPPQDPDTGTLPPNATPAPEAGPAAAPTSVGSLLGTPAPADTVVAGLTMEQFVCVVGFCVLGVAATVYFAVKRPKTPGARRDRIPDAPIESVNAQD